MKITNKILQIICFLCAFSVISANAQITDISQIKDVQPTDKHYQALQSLVERYGVYTDKTFRADDPLTREEFAVLLNKGLEILMEIANSADEDIGPKDLIEFYVESESNIVSASKIKDVTVSYKHYTDLESLIERYGINLCDADDNFHPTKTVTEKEFYTWVGNIFRGSIESAPANPSAAKAISRSDWVVVMNAAFDSVNVRINTVEEYYKKQKQAENKANLIKSLPAKGKAKITNFLKSYLPDNDCTDLTKASNEMKQAVDKGGIWNGYKMKDGDIGDIIFETNNTCKKGAKLVLLRIGTAIVTMSEKGIKRMK